MRLFAILLTILGLLLTSSGGARAVVVATYSLTIAGGSGSGSYAAGTVVSIKAGPAPSGEAFEDWTGATVANVKGANTTITMPAASTTVTANYATAYALTVVGGTGSGSYLTGVSVIIKAAAPPAGDAFQDWTGATVVSAASATTAIVMPAATATVTANYATGYALTVVGGSGSGTYVPGAVVAIKANAPPTGESFVDWTGADVANAKTANTTLTMPAEAKTVTANFASSYALTVVGGTGSGTYAAGTTVMIKANPPTAGEAFVDWTGATVANSKAADTSITMPAAAATVTANYAPGYALTVVSGTGGGTYPSGALVAIKANPPPAGKAFLDWTGATVANAKSVNTTITMSAAAATVTANYANGYALTVVNGTGSGTFLPGVSVVIKANAPPTGDVFEDWTGATVANANSATTAITIPSAAAIVTANYTTSGGGGTGLALTVVNGSGSGNYPAGTVVTITANAPPAGQAFLDWTDITTTFPWQPKTTLVMPTYATTVTAHYLPIDNATIPFPVTTHPRLWLTPADVTRLQGWAASSNPIYKSGMAPLLAAAVHDYNTYYFPGGAEANPFPDPGDVQGYGILPDGDASNVESQGVILAFNSLIDPSPANRITYAQDARNLLMVAMDQAVQGNLSNAPFRDPEFPTYNRANGSGEQWGLIVDWIYDAKDASNNPILTAADKATIRTVFLDWANDCLNAYTDYDDRPIPEGVTNSLTILPGNLPYRMASNNYYLGHARLMTMMALSIDPSDDPPINTALPSSQLGNTLRSYILDANGAWLYQEYAMMGDGPTVTSAYGVPSNPTGAGYGLAAGGLPPEGMLYGHSFGFLLGQLLALQTAGFNNPTYSGPQIGLIGAPVWDRFVQGYISSLTPSSFVPPSETYLGPVYQFASYGDLLRLWVTPDTVIPFALLDLLDQENGSSVHDNEARWLSTNVLEGGSAGLLGRVSDPWSWSTTDSILYFMMMNPADAPPTDPRPSYPTVFVDPGASRIVAHSDWTTPGTFFDYRASWISIYHQNGDGGQFEFFRNGDWLTKEMSNYDNNLLGLTTTYHNTLAIQNWCQNGTPSNLQFYEVNIWALGSQWMEGVNAGDPTSVNSSGPGYVYASSNLTNLYNRPDQWTPADAVVDVTQATRSIVWLNNDYIVVYDRATTGHAGFKKFNLCLVTNPAIAGSTATETLADGQQLFVQTVLPKSPTITSFLASPGLNPIADLEPTNYILQVQSSAAPATDMRFLHVLQGADPGASMVAATYLQSTAGVAYDGASFGTNAVYFPHGVGAFTGTTVPLPANVTTALITGLTPGGAYTATVGAGSIMVANGGTQIADSAGVLRLTP